MLVYARSFWDTISFIVNGIVFFFAGWLYAHLPSACCLLPR